MQNLLFGSFGDKISSPYCLIYRNVMASTVSEIQILYIIQCFNIK